jgi:CRP/FNR family transcriptional regulator, anaerobic regulatory protein
MESGTRFSFHRSQFRGALLRGEDKIAALMSGSSTKHGAGTTLVEDAEHIFVYRMIHGWASQTRRLADGRAQSILLFLPGDLFALKSMFLLRNAHTIEFLSDAVVERVDHQTLQRCHVQDEDVSIRCIWQLLEDDRRLQNLVVGLGLGNAEERLALLLIGFHERLAHCGNIAPEAPNYLMPLTQAQLGAHIGITSVHINRVLRSFREAGIVTISGGSVRISDMCKLRGRAAALLNEASPSGNFGAAFPGSVDEQASVQGFANTGEAPSVPRTSNALA